MSILHIKYIKYIIYWIYCVKYMLNILLLICNYIFNYNLNI